MCSLLLCALDCRTYCHLVIDTEIVGEFSYINRVYRKATVDIKKLDTRNRVHVVYGKTRRTSLPSDSGEATGATATALRRTHHRCNQIRFQRQRG